MLFCQLEIKRTHRCCSETESVTAQICFTGTEPHMGLSRLFVVNYGGQNAAHIYLLFDDFTCII